MKATEALYKKELQVIRTFRNDWVMSNHGKNSAQLSVNRIWKEHELVADEEHYSSNAVLGQNFFFIFFYLLFACLSKIFFLSLLFQRENEL